MIEVNTELVLELQKRVEQMEAEREAEKQAEAEQAKPEQSWVHVRVEANKGQYQWVQHGIGRTEEEARKNAHIKGGYKITKVEVIEPEIEPEKFELFHTLPIYADERKKRKLTKSTRLEDTPSSS